MNFATKEHLENVYAHLPARLQNATFTLYGLTLRGQRYGRHFHQKLAELKSSEWWSPDEIIEYQNQRLVEIIYEAYYYIPFYRSLFDDTRIKPADIRSVSDLELLPLMTKQTVCENRSRLINQRLNRKSLHKGLTSGTSGTPLTVYLTREALQFQWAVWWRHRARFGLHLGDKFLMFGARLPVPVAQSKPPFWRYNRAINQVYLSTYHLTPESIPVVVEWLNTENFDFFTGYPSAMYALAKYMQANDLRLLNRPKYIVTGADALLTGFEKTIRQVFGVPVTEQYGMAEACGNLAKCEFGRFHLDFEFCILELLPIPGLEHTKFRKLVFTGLANPAMPFIRYDIGDYGVLADGTCPCGRRSLSLEAIDGRVEEFIRTPDGRLVMGMNQVFEWAPGVRETQVVQNVINEIEVRIVPGSEFDAQRDQHILERELRKRVGNAMRLKFEVVESIPRTRNGKFRAVVSNLEIKQGPEQELRSAVQEGVL
jgi:phenylacetate-CoA ligase